MQWSGRIASLLQAEQLNQLARQRETIEFGMAEPASREWRGLALASGFSHGGGYLGGGFGRIKEAQDTSQQKLSALQITPDGAG